MSSITTRTAKGAPLTNAEIDANFTNLNADKLEKSGGSVTGALTVGGALAASTTLNITGASTLSGGVTAGSTLTVAGATALNNTLNVTGAVTAGSSLTVTGALTANGAVSANAGLTATKSYSATSAGSVPGLVASGSFGGGLALKDGTTYAGLYTDTFGADLHVYTGVTASDTAASKARLSILGASGNTGFGTVAPTAALHAYRSTAVEVSALAQNSAGYAKYGVDTSGVGQLVAGSWKVYANTTTLAVAVDSSGNVGIGTPATGARLDVQAASNAYSRLKTTSSGYALFDIDAVASQQSLIRLLAAGSEQGRISSGANEGAGIMVFATGTGATEAMRLIGGRVAINRNSASFSTGTARTAIAYPGNTDWALGLRDTSAQSTVYPIVFLNSSEGIAGSVAMTATSTSYNTSSDERLKENIEDAADPGAVIDAIQIRQFDWIATGEHQDYGVVAQELEQVYPPAVPEATVGPDGEEMYRGVDYSKLVPLLVKEVQLLRARVAQLEGGSQ